MENNAMTAPLDKKTVLKNLIETGKANGKLTTQDIDQAILDIDLDLEDLDKLYETIENQNIELVDDLSNVDLENVDFTFSAKFSVKALTCVLVCAEHITK